MLEVTDIKNEIESRRTFAIISHPDAGKTTLTEKLLLYGGAIELAGSVSAKKKQRETSSDWMELERKRGISVSSTVLQFEYKGFKLNLLDTPGHKDFSEDTYRVLTAVDAVIMVIDAGKGIESQTVKLFEICSARHIPIFTFINKLDRPALPPLELIDQIEKVLGISAWPACWPIESGPFFKGIYDRQEKKIYIFEKVPGGAYKAPVSVHGIDDPAVKEILSESVYGEVSEEIEMLDAAADEPEDKDILAGKVTPVFFGSAANNFGIELFLNRFLLHSSAPLPRIAGKEFVPPEGPIFSAFIFKIQTNMNSKHRDRMVFARICSGVFFRDMTVWNTRSGREVRISNSHNLFGRERETVDTAYAGDIIGFVTNGDFRIGDTLSSDRRLVFSEIPKFAPECFAYISNISTSDYKAFKKGLSQLLAEDIVQAFTVTGGANNLPLLGAVGSLQFDVLQYRLRDEYGVETSLELKPWSLMRWIKADESERPADLYMPNGCGEGRDNKGRTVVFFPDSWAMQYFAEKNPDAELLAAPLF